MKLSDSLGPVVVPPGLIVAFVHLGNNRKRKNVHFPTLRKKGDLFVQFDGKG